MIRLNVFIRTTESNRAEILSVAKELVTASLKDEGCIAYDIFESATRQDVLMICETWSDAKALAAHEQASHFTTLVPRLHQLGEMKVCFLNSGNGRHTLRILMRRVCCFCSRCVLSGEMDRMRGRACADPPPMALPVLSAGFASRFADYQREGESGAMEK